MKNKLALILCLSVFISNIIFAQNNVESIPNVPHPRLLFLKGDETGLKKLITSNPMYKKVDDAIVAEAAQMLLLKPLERKQIGRRLLSVSREAIRRIMYLSYAYRMKNEKKYADAAEREMIAIAGFENWNPTHFLDVAEMTTAMAIGYDWLFDVLPGPSKNIIKKAILEKGLNPSFNEKYNWFLKADHNWNQVCNAGMTLGALAIAEDEPELAKNIINRALKSIELPMDEYAPHGAYPEGYGYWGYGTSFNILFLSAVEKIFNTDFGLSAKKGFLSTADYLLNMLGSSGQAFSYSDGGSSAALNTSMFWFADKTKRPELLRHELAFIETAKPDKIAGDRLLPTLLIWGKDVATSKIPIPNYNLWVGEGLSPVTMMRTSWTDPNAIYLGFKAGSPSVNHAHMDIGSFVMDADGVRWAMDFGMQNYESLESKGMNIFGRTQYAERWTIFRYINTSHNTLTFNDSLQRVQGVASINQSSKDPARMFAISDMSKVYTGEIKRAVRGVGIIDKKYVTVQDKIETLDKPTKMRWSMVTPAAVKIVSNNKVLLMKDGKELELQIVSDRSVTVKTWDTKPTTDYDAENPGTTIVGFETNLPAGATSRFEVNLIPSKSGVKSTNYKLPL